MKRRRKFNHCDELSYATHLIYLPGRLPRKDMDIKIGDKFSTERKVTDELIRKFAELSGDFNPIHLDEEFAKTTRFRRRIAHGMLSGAFISAVLGNEFRERKIVYLSQTMKFVAPVFIGDTVTASGTIRRIRKDKGIVILEHTMHESKRRNAGHRRGGCDGIVIKRGWINVTISFPIYF